MLYIARQINMESYTVQFQPPKTPSLAAYWYMNPTKMQGSFLSSLLGGEAVRRLQVNPSISHRAESRRGISSGF